ncbi:MAG: RAMP superfamily CRISPR-associated protein [Phascolarctobacterium sp.]|nr:RAMP superfamily CRISPR-associated protein [Phascolarctobacterium sp.]
MNEKSKLIYKLIIEAKIILESPLRIASGEYDYLTDIVILKDAENRPYIPATSLAGVLRSELKKLGVNDTLLFGDSKDNDHQSLLAIDDVLLKNYQMVIRDGVKISSVLNTAIKGAKFDYELVDKGANGTLVMELTLRACHESKKTEILQNIDAVIKLLTDGVQVGSLTTKGFGKLKAQSIECYEFDFINDNSNAAGDWLKYIKNDQENWNNIKRRKLDSSKPRPAHDNFVMKLSCRLQNALLVRDYNTEDDKLKNTKDGEQNQSKDDKLDNAEDGKMNKSETTLVAKQLMSGDEYVIPGTSVKGVLRHRAEYILNTLMRPKDDAAKKKINDKLNVMMGYSTEQESRKSNLIVQEVYIKANPKENSLIRQARVKIDRFTGGVLEGPFFEKTLWEHLNESGPETAPKHKTETVVFNITIENRDKQRNIDSEIGLLLLLMKDIWLGNVAFGGGKNIGRGFMQGISCEIDDRGEKIVFENDSKGISIKEGDKSNLQYYVDCLVGELK